MSDHWNDDLQALARVTTRGVPSLTETHAAARSRSRNTLKEVWMSLTSTARRRPVLSGAVGVAALAAALLVVPVSYQHTTGYSVQLSARVPQGDDAVAQRISAEFAKALGATNVSVQSDGGDRVAFVADVPMRARSSVNAAASAFAREITRKGCAASAVVTPRVERVSGSVYAYAADAVNEIRVNATGKSDGEIASEIKTQLESHGFASPDVEVTSEGDKRQIKVTLSKTSTSTDADAPAPAEPPTITVTDDDKEATSTSEQKRVELRVDHEEVAGKTDAEVKALLEEKLRAQGVTATVEVKDGKIVKVDVQK